MKQTFLIKLLRSSMMKLFILSLLAFPETLFANSLCRELFNSTDHNLVALADKIRSGGHLKVGKNIFARILRGKSESDFTTLSTDPGREIVMLMDNEGIQNAFGGSETVSPLEKIGYTREYIHGLTSRGIKFKLLLLKGSPHIRPATWDNLGFYLEKVYGPGHLATQLFQQFLPTLKRFSFQQLQKKAGSGVDTRVNSLNLSPNMSVWEFRSFLYNELRLTELYTGNGFTETPDGAAGLAEYFTLNKAIRSESLGAYELIDLKP